MNWTSITLRLRGARASPPLTRARAPVMSDWRARRAAIARANARAPRYLLAARELARGAPELCASWSANPLALAAADARCAPCEAADASSSASASASASPSAPSSVAARWVADARALCDWAALPPALDVANPAGGAVPATRGARKRDQLLNVTLFLAPFLRLRPRATVADFACGAGHQTLHLAHHFPDATFVLIDFKARSLAVAERRANAAGLANVRCIRGRVEDFDEPFDVGVALHACGGASDAAMRKCVEANAAFVIAPCCVGKIAPGEGGERAVALARARREARRRAKAEAKANGAEAEAKANDASFAAASSSSSDADSDSDPFEDRRQSRETYPRSALASGVTTAEAYVAIARAADHADDEAEAEEEEEDAGAAAAAAATVAVAEGIPEDRDDGASSGPPLSAGARKLAAARAEKLAKKRMSGVRYDASGRVGAPGSARARERRAATRRACKALVEADRLRFAAERGFSVYASEMHPVSCTPKRDVLVGAPAGGEAARELEEGLRADAENPARALFFQEGG